MKRILIVLVALLAFTCGCRLAKDKSGNAASPIQFSGQIRGADWNPPPAADVYLTELNATDITTNRSAKVTSSGEFVLPVQSAGMDRVWITGANHLAFDFPIAFQPTDTAVKVTVTLAPETVKRSFDDVKIVGDWNNYKQDSAELMQKHADGTFVYERNVAADTLGYQLVGVADDQLVNGTMADEFRSHGKTYVSVLHVKTPTVQIVFDPGKLPHPRDVKVPLVAFDQGHSYLADFDEIAKRFKHQIAAYETAYDGYMKQHGTNKAFAFDLSPFRLYLEEEMRNGAVPEIKQFAAMHLVRLSDYDVRLTADTYAEVVKITPPNSPLWGLDPSIVKFCASGLGNPEGKTFLQSLVAQNSDHKVQGMALLALTKRAYLEANQEEYVSLYKQLKDRYGDVREIRYDTMVLNPDARITRGKSAPDFQVKLLDSNETVSNKSLIGKFYLIDFWATWCGPCVGEMPKISEAYDKYKDRNFTILSVSLDETPEAIKQFRTRSWKMPWLHSFVRSGQEALSNRTLQEKITTDFEVDRLGLPRTVLISPDGKILATQDELRGDALGKTLAKYLSP